MKIILLATVPHTGTWFMVEFFRSHPAVSNFVEIQVLQKASNLMPDGMAGRPGLASDRVNLVQGHFGYPAHEKLLLAFAAMCPLIIPLRDPLLGLIGKKWRGWPDENDLPQTGIDQIVGAWLELAAKVDAERDFYQPFYLPLDLLTNGKYIVPEMSVPPQFQRTASRQSKLCQALYVASLPDPRATDPAGDRSSFKHAQKWAEEWPHDKHNSRGMYPLKEAYLAGDAKKIRDAMPKAYYFLQQAEAALRPMLEREGYRELMWWT